MKALISIGLLIMALIVYLFATRDKVVNSVWTSKTQSEESVSCSHLGYCMECGLAFDGKNDCMPRFRSCSGTQRAIVDLYQIKNTHESGKISYSEDRITVKTLTACN